MKLLIAAVDAIIDKTTNKYFPGIKEALDKFESLAKGNTVYIISISRERLNLVPKDFKKLIVLDYSIRRSGKLIGIISQRDGTAFQDIIVLGSKDDDLMLSANAKVLLLTADYAKGNNPAARLYTQGYGIGILTTEKLKLFFERFLNVDEPWYYSIDVDGDTKLFGLTNAMTGKMSDVELIQICDKFRVYLKSGKANYRNQFLIYSLICTYRIFNEMEDIDYWGYYPSSQVGVNDELFDLKEILRKSFNSRNDRDIFIRHKNSPKRQYMSAADRKSDGCNSQFNSIHLNPWFKGRLKGKNICIIDDFTNFGTSCETVRHLLKAAGVNKIVFIALGKFRDEYIKYDYRLKGDLFTPKGFDYSQDGMTSLKGKINNESSNELYESLNHIVE